MDETADSLQVGHPSLESQSNSSAANGTTAPSEHTSDVQNEETAATVEPNAASQAVAPEKRGESETPKSAQDQTPKPPSDTSAQQPTSKDSTNTTSQAGSATGAKVTNPKDVTEAKKPKKDTTTAKQQDQNASLEQNAKQVGQPKQKGKAAQQDQKQTQAAPADQTMVFGPQNASTVTMT